MKRFPKAVLPVFFLLSFTVAGRTEELSPPVSMQVEADQGQGDFPPIWTYFGYDEPNYTYSSNGRKLLEELTQLSPTPVYVRAHNLLTSGDGTASLKWGSTNAYREDATGKAIYDWTIVDRIFDTYHQLRIRPLVEIGFMPEALSIHSQPYRHNFPHGSIFTGWAYPPKDYDKWSNLVFEFVTHLKHRYGEVEVKDWLWEVWNEPDIGYWQGTAEEYFKLYDFSVDAIVRALPQARVGGPDSTGPASPKAAEFLEKFLDHCARQKNYVSGKIGSRLDFVSFHPKGAASWQADHVRMGISHQLAAIEAGFKIVSSFPEWRHTPIVLGESDPEGCAACSAKSNPQNSYRNGPLFASYTAEVFNSILEMVSREHVNFMGAVTWSFEFEGQPYFEGFRELATNGVDKPVLNAFRMFGLLGRKRIKATSSASLSEETILQEGVRAQADIQLLATRRERELVLMIWNYHDDDVSVAPAPIDLVIHGLPSDLLRGLLEHFRIDQGHSNAFARWQEMDRPQEPSAEQYQQLERAGQLELWDSPRWLPIQAGTLNIKFTLPRQALSLLRLSW
ncbi:MAG: beta-xylosidase [Acidobacteria bacterium]|nr:beta-xylosidase [Acidobacteriota bacterium]